MDWFFNRKVCTVDLEFTGFNTVKDRVIEIGAVCANSMEQFLEGTTEKYLSLVHTNEISEASRKIHGITVEMVKDAPAESTVLKQLISFIGPRAYIIGHSIGTDRNMLRSMAERSNTMLPRGWKFIDTYPMSHHKFPTGHSLQSLATKCHYQSTVAHRALDDAETTRQVFMCIRPSDDLDAIYARFST